MKKAKKLQFVERLEIKILLNKGYSIRSIGNVMNRSPGTISDELKRNINPLGEYDPEYAQRRTYIRKWKSKSGWKKINQNNELRKYIVEKLKLYWSPDEISGRMKQDKELFYVSKTAIYEWLYSARGQYWCKYLYSKQYRSKRKKKKMERVMIPNRISFENRPLGATNRSRYGHYESDYVVSGRKDSGALSVTNERKTRLVKIYKAKTMKPQEHMNILKKIQKEINIKTITFDNGIENKYHEQLHELGIGTYFCDPYSSWQKGMVENTNKMIRRFIPKGTNISLVSDEYVKMIESILNNKPRRSLNYKTPLEVARKAGLLLS